MRRLAYVANVFVSCILLLAGGGAFVFINRYLLSLLPSPYNYALLYIFWPLVYLTSIAVREKRWQAFFARASLSRLASLIVVIILLKLILLITHSYSKPDLFPVLFIAAAISSFRFPFLRWGRIDDLSARVQSRDIRGVESMIADHPEQVNALTRSGDTPLILALASDVPLEVVRLLLEAGADPNKPNSRDISPLFIAVFFSMVRKNIKNIELLLKYGAKPDVPVKGNITPLHMVASRRYAEITRLLLEYGTDANVINYRGETPLHFAARNGNMAVVKMLLEHGADVNAQTAAGATPLKLAEQPGILHRLFARKGRRSVIDLLRQQASMG